MFQSQVKMLPNTNKTHKKLPNIFNILPKWRNFAKSGHTDEEDHQKLLFTLFYWNRNGMQPIWRRAIDTKVWKYEKNLTKVVFSDSLNEVLKYADEQSNLGLQWLWQTTILYNHNIQPEKQTDWKFLVSRQSCKGQLMTTNFAYYFKKTVQL